MVQTVLADEDIPEGSVGQVVLIKENGRRRVRWVSGREFNIKWQELIKVDNQMVTITFTQPGTLGLSLKSKSPEHKAELISVKPGTQAASFPEIVAGMSVQSVDGQPMGTYRQAMAALKAAGRPVTVAFKFEDIDEPTVAAPKGLFESTFDKVAPLGIVWHSPQGGLSRCVIKSVKTDSKWREKSL